MPHNGLIGATTNNNVVKPATENRDTSFVTATNACPGAIGGFMNDVGHYLPMKDRASLAGTCKFFYSIFQPNLYKQAFEALQALFQAIIDEKHDIVKEMLDKNPQILLYGRREDHIIQSHYTWQRFKISPVETPLSVAAKRRQLEMIMLLLPYYDQLEKDPKISTRARQAKVTGLNAWSYYEVKKNEIVIPKAYTTLIFSLLDTFDKEDISNITDVMCLSNHTENAIGFLLNLLAPKGAVELDNCIDVELLLLAAYRLFANKFGDANRCDRGELFYLRVIGLIQSAVLRRIAVVLCGRLDFYGKDISAIPVQILNNALLLKLSNFDTRDRSFYREDRESLSSGTSGSILRADFCGDACVFKCNCDTEHAHTFQKVLLDTDALYAKLIQQSPLEQQSQPIETEANTLSHRLGM